MGKAVTQRNSITLVLNCKSSKRCLLLLTTLHVFILLRETCLLCVVLCNQNNFHIHDHDHGISLAGEVVRCWNSVYFYSTDLACVCVCVRVHYIVFFTECFVFMHTHVHCVLCKTSLRLDITSNRKTLRDCLHSKAYPKPHQVSKVNSLWSIRKTLVREVGKLDS